MSPSSPSSPRPPPRKPKPKALFIIGPTGTGKSSLAVSLASRFDGEILNADAMQLYQGLPIITNKISAAEQRGIPHHLLDFLPLEAKPWTVHRYVREASRVIEEMHARGKLPILVGGTSYYLYGVLCGGALLESEVDEQEHEQEHGDNGDVDEGIEWAKKRWPVLNGTAEEMYAELKILDPEMADSWHPKDWRRVQRSLEISLRRGRKVSDIYQEQREREQKNLDALLGTDGAGMDQDMLNYDPLLLWLQAEDRVLKDRLDARVLDMVRDGLFEEVLAMQRIATGQQAHGVEMDKTKGIWVSIGYKETEEWTAQQLANPQPLDLAKQSALAKTSIEAVQASTRRYAKRQERYIRMSFAKALQKARASDRLLLLDGTDLSKFHSHVVPQAEELTAAFLEGRPLPEPESLSDLARQMFTKIRDESPHRSMRVKRWCEVCDRTLMTDKEWETHMASRSHNKAVQGRKKHHQMLLYLLERRQRQAAPEVDVAS